MSDDLRVLIVDDDFHVARLHARYVNAAPGYSALETVGSGGSALEAIQTYRPDLVLIDIYLPDGNGLDILRGVDVDAFVLSAASDAVSLRKAMRTGALGYLIKPFSEKQLSDRLRGYARYRRLLASGPDLDQDLVDRALRQLYTSETQTARARSVTETAVLGALGQTPGALTAIDVSIAVGIARATAQRYLSALVEDGSIEVNLRYGTTGRPEHQYSIRPA
jgi:two-component system, CitB family, response regulator